MSADLASRVREELALALRDTRVTLPDLAPLERAQAERVYACTRVAWLALDHEAIADRADRAEARERTLARVVLEYLDSPSAEGAAELRDVAGRIVRSS